MGATTIFASHVTPPLHIPTTHLSTTTTFPPRLTTAPHHYIKGVGVSPLLLCLSFDHGQACCWHNSYVRHARVCAAASHSPAPNPNQAPCPCCTGSSHLVRAC